MLQNWARNTPLIPSIFLRLAALLRMTIRRTLEWSNTKVRNH